MMTSDKLNNIFSFFDELFPQAGCELDYSTDYGLLFAVILSAQTTDKKVNKVTPALFNRFSSLKSFSLANVNEVASIIKSIGLFQTKARYIVETSKILVNDFQSKVPSSKEELVSLPGVGNKTANVVRAELFKIPEIAVDTHVSRISVRLKLALPTDSVKQIEEKLRNQIDVSRYIKTHHQMIHFGRYFCTARKPLCFKCKLVNQCGEKKKILLEK